MKCSIRLDRILQVEILSETFTRPTDFQALAAVQHALASVPRAWQIEVWLGTTLEMVQRQTHLTKAQFEEVPNGVLLRGDVEDLQWASHLLAGLGVPFIIHRPPNYELPYASMRLRWQATLSSSKYKRPLIINQGVRLFPSDYILMHPVREPIGGISRKTEY